MMLQHDFAVVGGGPVGLSTALGLAHAGHTVALIAPKASAFDSGRTAALMAPALEMLAQWLPIETLDAIGATLDGIRIIDVTGALFRAPTVTFRASEIGLDRFGLNLPNDKLVAALTVHAEKAKSINWYDAKFDTFASSSSGHTVTLSNGSSISARAIIGADGKASAVRDLADIKVNRWSYQQSALTFHVRHERDHLDISTEFHTREGPFTLVPLENGQSSVVWMMKQEKAQDRLAMEPSLFMREAQQTCQAILGRMTLASERALIPMTGLAAATLAKGTIALIGEAAHAFPPIGAQGLNLGMRDLRDLLKALSQERDFAQAFSRYAAMRRNDVAVRTTAVDAMNRSLLAGFLPVDALRSLGMSAIAAVAPLRRAVMRAGIGHPLFQGNRSAAR
jgi:2-octaprenyl-6-methoxyphenol hydroxylase